MSNFKIVSPESTTNLFIDPQFGQADPDTPYDISATGGSSPDVTRSTTDQWIGTGCAVFAFDGASAMVMKDDVSVTAVSYTLSMRVKRTGGGTVSNSEVQVHFDTANANFDSITADRDNWWYCVYTATATAGTRAFGIRALEDGLLTDAWQLEQKAYVTTYCDGSIVGNRPDGYVWNGAKNASASTRHAQERSGGRVRDIEDDLNVKSVTLFQGGGENSLTHNTTEMSLLPGELYQSTKTEVRAFDLGVTFSGTSISDLHSDRQAFMKELRVNKTTPNQPFRFRYTGAVTDKEINALYLGGMGGRNPSKFIEKVVVRMLAVNPYWRALGSAADSIDPYTTDTNADYVLQRSSTGQWAALTTGTNEAVYAIDTLDNTNYYIGGLFTQAGGVSNTAYIAKWDGTAWTALATGMTGGDVRALTFGPDGSLYAGGQFTDASGVANTAYIAKWDGSAWSALGTGMNAFVRSLAFGPDGNLYAGGNFTLAGGVANTAYIAKWDGSAWSALGTGMNSAVYEALTFGPDESLYAGGAFTLAGGVADTVRIAKWDGSAWSALGTGMNGEVTNILVDSDGTVYATGLFTLAGGVANTVRIAKWDGSAWSALGTGLNNTARIMRLDIDGALVIGGDFTTAGGLTFPDRLAKWTGSRFIPIGDVELPGSPSIWGLHIATDGKMTVGFTTSGTASMANVATVTNAGSAEAYPIITMDGPGTVFQLANFTTRTFIYFDLTLLTGETATINFSPERQTFTSDFRGDLRHTIVSGSELSSFLLQPGDNYISLYINNASATASIEYTELHETIDS